MDDGKIHSKPSEVETAAGEVLVSGPDGVAVSLTPEAAIETGVRLIDGGAEAHGRDRLDQADVSTT
jgi:hypothetical protein